MTCGHGRKRGMTCAQLIALRDKVKRPPLTQFKAVNYGGRFMYKKPRVSEALPHPLRRLILQ